MLVDTARYTAKIILRPTVRLDNVRMLLARAAHYDWEVHPVDVKTAFLHAPLDEDVYMDVPEGVETDNGKKGNCIKLQKALYGLKQASRAWNKTSVGFIKSLKFKQLATDSSVFTRRSVAGDVIIVVQHVDDQNVFASTLPLLVDFKVELKAQNDIDDIGEKKYFFGLEVLRDQSRQTIKL